MAKQMWKISGVLVIGLTTFSIARGAVPGSQGGMRVTDDTALYQQLSEIKAPRAARPDFDGDLKRLAGMEGHYREKLPALRDDARLTGAMKRISARKYRPGQAGRAKPVRN